MFCGALPYRWTRCMLRHGQTLAAHSEASLGIDSTRRAVFTRPAAHEHPRSAIEYRLGQQSQQQHPADIIWWVFWPFWWLRLPHDALATRVEPHTLLAASIWGTTRHYSPRAADEPHMLCSRSSATVAVRDSPRTLPCFLGVFGACLMISTQCPRKFAKQL